MENALFRRVQDGLLINIKIVPNSSRNEIVVEEEFIKVKVTAQPIENKANKALIEYLSKLFKVPKSSLQIVKGETSKDKVILVKTTEEEKINNISTILKKEEGV